MSTELYADSISEITVTGTIIRIDFSSLSATDRDQAGQPRPVTRQRVIMSVEGFANSFEVLEKAMNGLIEAGAIRRNGGADLAGPTDAGPHDAGPPKRNGAGPSTGSPNFA